MNEQITAGSSSNSNLTEKLKLIEAKLAAAEAEHETKMETINSILSIDDGGVSFSSSTEFSKKELDNIDMLLNLYVMMKKK